jgi:hypothetical protein
MLEYLPISQVATMINRTVLDSTNKPIDKAPLLVGVSYQQFSMKKNNDDKMNIYLTLLI